ncbi:DUF721 domain-containing protein [Henriciella mobilis]|uniref:DUF721 domain-containing protein n=2 Tax=Henriciella mobilis TaxID=2305467 RepID=A0A399RSE1_9PROT|nr:DUF721 domain-containing protein [Henriciella mobilis]
MRGTIALMVARSSLDPLEEARARIALRYQRGKRADALPDSFGKLALQIARKKVPDKGPAIGRLKLLWPEIVGEQLAKVCEPEKIGASGKGKGRVLSVKCIPAASTMVQHQSETIRQRVAASLGGDIREVRITQGPLTRGGMPAARKRKRPLSADERKFLDESVASIEDPALRKAILALGEAVLTTDES